MNSEPLVTPGLASPAPIVVDFPEGPTRRLPAPTALAGSSQTLSEFLCVHGIPLNTRCGGRGLCESCTVELLAGTALEFATGKEISSNGSPVLVKACEVKLPVSATIETRLRVPARSHLRYRPQIVTEWRVNIPSG